MFDRLAPWVVALVFAAAFCIAAAQQCASDVQCALDCNARGYRGGHANGCECIVDPVPLSKAATKETP